MRSREEAETLALSALGWVLGEDERAQRLLALTGMDADMLRHNLSEPATLAAVLEFLANHEADLIGAAAALEIAPEQLLSACEALSR